MDNGKTATIERKAVIFNIQKYNMYDGPGIRTLVFFKGCPLRCQWCANPEGLERKCQVMYKKDFCRHCGACTQVCPVGIHEMVGGEHRVNRNLDCIGCRRCQEICPADALSIMGEVKTISELLKIIEEDTAFYDMSGGGVTLGGGEVLMQPEAAANLLMACKKEGIHTAIETSGYCKKESLLQVAEFTDLFLYDIKHMDPERHHQLTGVRNEMILENLKELLHRRYNVKIRMPLLRGVNDQPEDIDKVIQFLMPYRDDKNFKGIDLLPYHKLGVSKYQMLEMNYPMTGEVSLREEDLTRIEQQIQQYHFPVAVVRH